MRLGNQRSVTNSDYAQRRVIDQSARCRLPPGPVDFMAVNNSNRRDRLSAYGLQLDTLWDKRTGDENRLLFNFLLLAFRSFLDLGVSKHRPGSHAGRNENCSAFRYRHLHKQKLHPGSYDVQIIEAMAMALSSEKQERQ
jgi:hypothetical protein